MPRIFMIRFHVVAAFGLLMFAAGCGPNVKVTPAEGIVLIDGKPAKGILVQFHPDSTKGATGPSSQAVTGDDGKFKLQTYDGRLGAVIGTHRITLSDTLEERVPQGQVAKNAPRLAGRYATIGELSAVVQEKGGPIEVRASAQ